jgi:hypothetical protein
MIRSNAIRKAARGQDCTVNITGVCNYNPETVIFAHYPNESKGMGIKASDICGGFSCSNCHDALDGRTKSANLDAYLREFYMRRSMVRTLTALVDMGIITIKGNT